jgi:hypothetical protein
MTNVRTAKRKKRSASKERGLRAGARRATSRNAKDRVLTANMKLFDLSSWFQGSVPFQATWAN